MRFLSTLRTFRPRLWHLLPVAVAVGVGVGVHLLVEDIRRERAAKSQRAIARQAFQDSIQAEMDWLRDHPRFLTALEQIRDKHGRIYEESERARPGLGHAAPANNQREADYWNERVLREREQQSAEQAEAVQRAAPRVSAPVPSRRQPTTNPVRTPPKQISPGDPTASPDYIPPARIPNGYHSSFFAPPTPQPKIPGPRKP